MSDYIVKIIPKNPDFYTSEQNAQEIVNYLKSRIPAVSVIVTMHETPVFVDCGSNLEKISCPLCKAELDFDWWGEAMNKAYENNFRDLSVEMSCCGGDSTLNDLVYDFPCGFSKITFELLNPQTEPDKDCLVHIENVLGSLIRTIHAHV